MPEMQQRQRAIKVAWSYYGLWYKWGGDDPSGFDCSGLAIECLKSVGALPRKGDWTAQSLFNMFPLIPREQIYGGDLVFWSNAAGRVIHVEIVLDYWTSIGASGGGSGTKTEADAIAHNAFIKSRPIFSRAGVH
jgi:cell wall-associated NlpC family hydrolase